MKFDNVSLEYRTLILLLGSLYAALILMIFISLSMHEKSLDEEYGRSLEFVFDSIKKVQKTQFNPEFLSKCNENCDGVGNPECILCEYNHRFTSLDLEYFAPNKPLPKKTVSRIISLDDGSSVVLSVSEEYINEKMTHFRNMLLIIFITISTIFTVIAIILNKKLFYALKCLVDLCNDTTEQSDTVSYCPCSYEIKDLRDAITKLLIKNQSLFEKKSDMFKEIAHELKSPIAIMQARLSLLSVDDTPSNVEKYINETDEDIEDVKNIIYELLFLEEIEMEIQNTHKSDISMRTECKLMQGKFGPILELNHVEVNAPWNEDFHIYTFKHSIRKVLQAVYENVFIHTQKGSTINVEVDAKNKTMLITNEAKSLADRESAFKSTKIGTKIIKRLSEKLDFTFSTELKNNIYTTTITFHS
ncbi:hypothetical protein GJV85_00525 [Sulfurimonas aquatica]|uniref:histidine kinase n=1 Tax=Sulfurimonas aquatica TaxID=2672570 RepID=A0A975AY32_9BACT|nr:HAMP domain-containing histidine kinase [Sulfurimonas aquatica]QSZ40664.1 hypothetical protein GJV85_00525 [Sulfurimonas aquatica]